MNSPIKLALLVLVLGLCNGTHSDGEGNGRTNSVAAQQMSDGSESDFGLVGSTMMHHTTNLVPAVAPAPNYYNHQTDEMSTHSGMARAGRMMMRFRRQIQYPPNSPLAQGQPQVGQQPAQTGGLFNYLSELGPQMAQAKAISSLFNGNSSPSPSAQSPSSFMNALTGANPSQQSSSGLSNVAQMMAQLTDLIKSTQDRNARMLETTQQTIETTGHQTASAAKSAQGGIQSALTEIGQGLQNMARNNPNLLPDIKNLYQSVSAKLSSASTSVAQTAQPSSSALPALPVAQS